MENRVHLGNRLMENRIGQQRLAHALPLRSITGEDEHWPFCLIQDTATFQYRRQRRNARFHDEIQ
ncbi:hypothetical protein D3C87_1154710 [compost metagenome]